MTRRSWMLTLGTAVAAAGAGLAWHWVRSRDDPPAAPGELWALRLDRPDGRHLALADFRGKIMVINFWATWCPPCVEELPAFDRLHRERGARGVVVVGLAIDGAKPVQAFLARQPVGFAIGLAGFEGTELTRRLGNTTGALPFTVLLDSAGRVRRRKLGQTDFAELSHWLDELGA